MLLLFGDGLTTDEIARAFPSSEAAIAQRIVARKKAIARAGLAFEVMSFREEHRSRPREQWRRR